MTYSRLVAILLCACASGTTIDTGALSQAPAYPPPVPAGVKDNRADALFATGLGATFTTSRGVDVPWPFAIYNTYQTAIIGTISLEKAKTLLAGTGRTPIEIANIPNKGSRAVLHVMTQNILDSSVGPYRELIAWIDVTAEDAPDAARVLPYVNAFSTFVPLARGDEAFVLQLVVDNQDALDVGREAGGLDKVPGELSLQTSSVDAFSVHDGEGLVVEGRFSDPLDENDLPKMAADLAAALGLPELPPSPEVLDWRIATWDAEAPSRLKLGQARIKAVVIHEAFDAQKHQVHFGRTGLGKRLGVDLDFEPTLVGFGADVKSVTGSR